MALSTIPTRALSEQGINFRNLIINGDMSIAQRGTTQTGITSSQYPNAPDRFHFNLSSAGTWTISQSTDVPSGQGFGYSEKFQCTTADVSLASSDFVMVRTLLEAQNLQHLKYGTSSAESLTLSFWVKSNKTGTYVIWFYADDGNRTISKAYTISSADTWEKKTITIDGDTAGTINNDNGIGFRVNFYLGAGSNYTSGTLASSWQTDSNGDRAVGQVNLADSTSNYINITGVQLEVGTTASDFEFLPYDVNLRRCERYTRRLGDGLWGKASSTTNMIIQAPFFSPMRATPSISAITSAIKTSDVTAADYTSSTGITGANINAYGARLGCSNFSGLTSANMYILYDNSSYIALIDAEL